MLTELKGGVVGLRACDEAIEKVQTSSEELKKMSKEVSNKSSGKYTEIQKVLIEDSQNLAISITQLFQTTKSDPQSVGNPSKLLSEAFNKICESIKLASEASNEVEVKKSLLLKGSDIAEAITSMIEISKKVASDPKNDLHIIELSNSFQDVTERVTDLIRAAKQGATGEKDCMEAIGHIRKTVSDLDSSAVFASTGEFQYDSTLLLDQAFSSLVDITSQFTRSKKNLEESVNESHIILGDNAKKLAKNFIRLGESTKILAGITDDVVSQSEMLSNAKVIGQSSQQFITACQQRQSNSKDQKVDELYKSKISQMETSLFDFIDGIKNAIGSSIEGVEKVSSCIKTLHNTLNDFNDQNKPAQVNKEFIKALREINKNLPVILTASSTGDSSFVDCIKEIQDNSPQMLQSLKKLCSTVNNNQTVSEISENANKFIESLISYLETSKIQKKNTESYQDEIAQKSENATKSINTLLLSVRNIPGCEELEMDENSLESLASSELLQAAKQIEEAANNLLSAPVRNKSTTTELDEQDISALILGSAKEVTSATYELIVIYSFFFNYLFC